MAEASSTPLMEKQEAEVLLGPYLEALGSCIEKAWDEWNTFYSAKHHILDSRARAAIVYCHLKVSAIEAFNALPGTVCKVSRGLFFVFVSDRIKLRFKKADRRGRTSNVPTKQQVRLQFHMELPGMESGALLNACYQLDELQLGIERSMITQQWKRSVTWEIPLNERPMDGFATASMPSDEPGPSGEQVKRARAKNGLSTGKKIERA